MTRPTRGKAAAIGAIRSTAKAAASAPASPSSSPATRLFGATDADQGFANRTLGPLSLWERVRLRGLPPCLAHQALTPALSQRQREWKNLNAGPLRAPP